MEALADARAELEALVTRQAELEAQIAEAEAAIGISSPRPATSMTLHDALTHVLRERADDGMTARDLADAVNDRDLYRKRDGSPVEINQIHARVNNYPALFEKDGPLIRQRKESPALTSLPASVVLFRDDDVGFFEWLDENPDGYFINTERNPKPNYMVLHRSQCPHVKGDSSLHWTKDYVKVASTDRQLLEDWAADAVGGDVTLCRSCFG